LTEQKVENFQQYKLVI